MSNKSESSIGYVIGTTRRLILRELGAVFTEHNIPITIEQYIFLHTLMRMKYEVTQQDMANHICKDKSSILRTIDALEQQGLVQRQQVSGDRRKNTLSVTPQCEKLFEQLFELESQTLGRLTQGINAEDYQTAVRVLEQIQHNASNLAAHK